MKFKPLNKRVLVKLDEAKMQTDAGIYLPQTAQNDFSTGKVIAVGTEAALVKEGDRIMFAHSVGVDIEVDGEKLRLIPDESYIDAVI
jgi:co-chaperonin GroES (HSP10)|tara:strand:- start:398 stop:658 length:261 start_codon:yes stop_codon:yes gene_type:complete